jgi:hypothetical protein
LADPLSPNLSFTDIEAQLLGFNFSDGVTTYTLATANIVSFAIGTDVSGNIDEWQITLQDLSLPTPPQVGDSMGMFETLNRGSVGDSAVGAQCLAVVSDVQ